MTAVGKKSVKASDHSDVDMFAQALQFSSIMSTDEVIKITYDSLITKYI